MNLVGVLEGILFVVGEDGISKDKILEIMNIEEENLNGLINILMNRYSKEEYGINIAFFGNKYKLVTKKEHKEYYKKLVDSKYDDTLSQGTLETLAIIAYNSPITRSTIEEIRGVNSDYHVRKLIARDLIKEVGKSDLPGRPTLYAITDLFLDYFGLSSIDELPKIKIKEEQIDEVGLFESKYKDE